MEPVISHSIPVTALSAGDSVIGADTKEYIIVAIEECDDVDAVAQFMELNNTTYPDGPTGLKLTCNNEDGLEVHTVVPYNATVDAILKRAQSLEVAQERAYGMKRCMECATMRSIAREWAEDDYICKVCRHLLDSGHA
jgi:hypothetical protein